MPPKGQIESAIRDIERLEGEVNYIQKTILPELYTRINKLDIKITAQIAVWSVNLVLLGAIIKKLYFP